MKLNDIKHNHSLTDLLKILIFSILMMIPFIDVGTRCLYVICNKNAYQSYSDSNLIQTNTIPTNYTQIIENNVVQFNYFENTSYTGGHSIKYGFKSISFNPLDYGWNNRDWNSVQFIFNGSNKYIYLFDTNNDYQAKNIWGTSITSFAIVSNGVNTDVSQQIGTEYTQVSMITYQSQKLDNIFDYSVNKLSQSEL